MLKSLLLSAVLTAGVATAALAQTSTTPTTPSPSTAAPSTTAPTTTMPGTTRPSAAVPSTSTMPATPNTTAAAPGAMKASTLMSLNVKNHVDENIGDIDDVIVTPDGRIQQVVVSVGGFLGVGVRKVAIAWEDVTFDPARDVALVNMTKEQLKVAPEFVDRRPVRANTATVPPAPKSSP